MKDYRDHVIVLNGESRWCRAKRKKTLAPVEGVYTLCGGYVTPAREIYRPGIAIVTCSRCRALEQGKRFVSDHPVAPRRGPA